MDKNKKMWAVVAGGVIIVILIIILLTRQAPTTVPMVEINGLPGEEILLNDDLIFDPTLTPEPIVETPLQ